MGSNNNNRHMKKNSGPFAVFNIFKVKRSNSRVEDSRDDYYSSTKAYKVWTSDEDRGRYVAEPGIDRKATAFITKYRAATQNVLDHDLRQATHVSN